MKNRSILRAMFLALLFVASLTAAAQYVVSTGNHVRLRTGPSTSYPMLVWNSTGKPVWINKGQSLTYLGDANGFYRVLFDGKSVYISKQFSRLVYPNSGYTSSYSGGSAVVVNGTHVRLRWGPSLNASIYSNSYGQPIYPARGARLTYLGQSGNWYKVRYNGNVLYISKDYSYLR
jgi:hypothetical protein